MPSNPLKGKLFVKKDVQSIGRRYVRPSYRPSNKYEQFKSNGDEKKNRCKEPESIQKLFTWFDKAYDCGVMPKYKGFHYIELGYIWAYIR